MSEIKKDRKLSLKKTSINTGKSALSIIKKIFLWITKNKLFQVTFSTIIIFIILEVIVRMTLGPSKKWVFLWNEHDLILHHKLKPNLDITQEHHFKPYHLKTNSQSWVEDYDIALKKPDKVFRIFYVGDSNVMGCVNQKEKMVTIVEDKLNNQYSSKDIQFEVINTGTSSYSPLLYYLLIKTKVLDYDPDLVVINIDMTDVINDAAYKKMVVEDSSRDPIAVRPTSDVDAKLYRMTPEGVIKISKLNYIREQVHQYLSIYSALYYHLENYLYKRGNKPAAYTYESSDQTANWLSFNWTKEIEESINYSMDILKRAILLLKDNKVKVAITSIPHYPQFTGVWNSKPHERLDEFAKKNNVPYLNMYQKLNNKKAKGENIAQYYYSHDETHFNELGHAFWAEKQLEFLVDEKNNLFNN